jgi:hypothetical protein
MTSDKLQVMIEIHPTGEILKLTFSLKYRLYILNHKNVTCHS